MVAAVVIVALIPAWAPGGDTTSFVLSFEVDEALWSKTEWAEPPQVAIWLENEETGAIRTLFVSYRTAKDEWVGQSVVPASLPYWVSRYREGAGRDEGPTRGNPLPDAVTGPTPKGSFSHAFDVPDGSWDLYLEVNVSGDYNRHYVRVERNGVLADFGAGQPSLVYRALGINAVDRVTPVLLGMTTLPGTEGTLVQPRHITSADRLLRSILLKKGRPAPGKARVLER
jgi:hypothetical protein